MLLEDTSNDDMGGTVTDMPADDTKDEKDGEEDGEAV